MQRHSRLSLLVWVTLSVAAPTATADVARESHVITDGESVTLVQSPDGDTLNMTFRGSTLRFGQCATRKLKNVRRSSVRATVEERNCGATVDFATWVVLDVDGDRYPAVVFAGRPRVELAIEGGRLLVRHSPVPEGQIFDRRSQVQGIAVGYEVRGPPVGQPLARCWSFQV